MSCISCNITQPMTNCFLSALGIIELTASTARLSLLYKILNSWRHIGFDYFADIILSASFVPFFFSAPRLWYFFGF